MCDLEGMVGRGGWQEGVEKQEEWEEGCDVY